MGETLGFLATGIFGLLAVRYAVPVVDGLQRANEATSRRLPRGARALGRRPNAAYGLLTFMLAGCGYICIITGAVGLIYAVAGLVS